MDMSINNSYNNYNNQLNSSQQTLNRVATGIALNQSADNPAALAIANQLMAEGNALSQAVNNTTSGIAMMNIADYAMDEQSNILDQVQQKLVQAGSDTTSADGREAILKDVQALMQNFNQIAETTNYNGTSLLQQSDTDNSASDSLTFQAGTDSSTDISSSGIQANSTGVGLDALLAENNNTFTAEVARNYLEDIGNAQDTLNSFRSDIGSTTQQLESATRNLISERVATESAKSIIMDTDFAKESSNFTSQNILSQAGAYTIAQANATQAHVMKLLQ